MPRSTKPITFDQRNSRVASCGQRIQRHWRTASDERKAELRALWPEFAEAIIDLDVLLELPVIMPERRYAFGEIPGRPGGST